MPTTFPSLLAAGSIGPMLLRNRIVLCPMGDVLADPGGTVSDRQLAYYEARARGGAALLLVGSVAVTSPVAAYHECQVSAGSDAHVDGLRRLADAAHRHGARIAGQLVHNGAAALLDYAEGRPALVPSVPKAPAPDALSRMMTDEEQAAMYKPFLQPGSAYAHRVADEDDLAAVLDAFEDAAARLVAAGFDGIEIHAGHGYLIDTFLSPAVNTRTDRWGGDVAGRARLLTEVLGRVRARVGPDVAVWCRMNAFEAHKPGGETFDDALAVADLAVAAGADALHVSAYAEQTVAIGITEAHTPHEPELLVPYAARIKARVPVPVITFGRIEPEAAERVVADGKADFVAMGRKLLADPDLPNKLAAGRVDDVRPCLYQYRCIGNIFLNEPVGCVANAATAAGDEDPDAFRTDRPRHVLVAGAGPAGLEVARLLASHGHRVTLADPGARPGGALALAARADDALDRFLGWLVHGVDRADVDLRLLTPVDAALVDELGVDEVVVATGGTWSRPAVPGADRPEVRTVDELAAWFEEPGAHLALVGRRVVIAGGGKAGLSIAALALAHGREVTVVEPTKVLAPELGLPGRFRLVHDVETAGAQVLLRSTIASVDAAPAGEGVVVAVRGRGDDLTDVVADTVVVVAPVPDRRLVESLRAAVAIPVHDLVPGGDLPSRPAPYGGIEQAMAGARRVAQTIA